MANSDRPHDQSHGGSSPEAPLAPETPGAERPPVASRAAGGYGGIPEDELEDLYPEINSNRLADEPTRTGARPAAPSAPPPPPDMPTIMMLDRSSLPGFSEAPPLPEPPSTVEAGDASHTIVGDNRALFHAHLDAGAGPGGPPTVIEAEEEEEVSFASPASLPGEASEEELSVGPDESAIEETLDADAVEALPADDSGAVAHLPPPPPPPHHRVSVGVGAGDPHADLPPGEPRTHLNDHGVFRLEAQKLARAREWQKLAAITGAAVDHATWVRLPETRAALLLDLARIHRDRLADPIGAEEAFARVAEVDPTNEDALTYLSDVYRKRDDWRAIYDLYSAAIEPTWDPNQRLAWTRETADIATARLRSPDLAIAAWERLERLGDGAQESYHALSEMYRRAGRWQRLAQFLGKRSDLLEGPEKLVALREVAEAYLLGLHDHEHAGRVLEELLDARPSDPVALLGFARVLTQRGDWESLASLGARSLDGVPKAAVLDFRRAVAEALWSAGDLERALVAHDRVLDLDPEDPGAHAAKEQYLVRTGKADALVHFLTQRADGQHPSVASDAARAELYARAAEIAEKQLEDYRLAINLWERRVALPAGQLEAHQALERLYDQIGDLQGVGRSLDGQLAVTRDPAGRVALLRRLGDHSAHRLGDDARAEACWKEIVTLVPDDQGAHDELLALHRRRGDFEALDRSLGSLAWRSTDVTPALGFWRTAASNVQENLVDPRRSIQAWQRVLDLAPGDRAALAALVGHHRALGQKRELIATLEAELRAEAPTTGAEGEAAAQHPERTSRALEIARLWEEEGDRVASLAAYERVLQWSPTDDTALAAIARLRKLAPPPTEGPLAGKAGLEMGAAIGALEVAAAVKGDRGDADGRIALLRQALALHDEKDARARFYGLRRLLWLSGRSSAVLAEVEQAAEAAGAWPELAAIYRTIASETTDPTTRAAHHAALAKLYEEKLGDPVRAFLVLQATHRRPMSAVEDEAALEGLARLADATGRHEDLLALLDVAAGAEVPLATRRAMLRRRAEVCEKKLKDPTRAFAECERLLLLDPHDADALADARRLAEVKGLWRALDAIYAERGDRATGNAERIDVARARHAIHAERLQDPIAALDQLLVVYRLDPHQAGLTDQLLADADAHDAWDRVLPTVEAKVRAVGGQASPDELGRLAGLHEHQREDKDHAFELYAEAFTLRPAWRELEEDLGRLADGTGRHDRLAAAYRQAAAHAPEAPRKLELYRRLTTLHAERTKDVAAGLDAHRRILQLEPASASSLEVVIDRHREGGEWRDLRDRLQQWAEHADASAADSSLRVARWLEIARLSKDRLSDPETALECYAKVLAVAPTHAEALDGVRALDAHGENPRFELRRLRIELPRAEAARKVELELACARIERDQLRDPAAAIATLRALVEETGADGPGYAPLAALLRAQADHAALLDLMEARASALPDPSARVGALEEAVALAEEHPAAAPFARKERLYRRLLDERPSDAETLRQLLSLYRDAGAHEPLAERLRAVVVAPVGPVPGLDADERRQLEEELARTLAALGRMSDADQVLVGLVARHRDDGELLLARARVALARGDVAAYLDLRREHARQLPAAHAALVLCHLAETCDETPEQQLRVPGFYREARGLDPQNPCAMEALKAIGRRAKNWRSMAALLPDADEAKLAPPARAERLTARGDAAPRQDSTQATEWYLRAVAVDPDHFAAWDALAGLRAAAGDQAGALQAHRASLAAWERATPPSAATLHEQAARITQVAAAFLAAGDAVGAARLSLYAYRLSPSYAPAAVAVADQRLAAGDDAAAYGLYDRVLRLPSTASDADRLHATWRRGALAWQLGKRDDSVRDLLAALRLDPLHGGALTALATALAETGHIAQAAERYVQSLVVEHDSHRRGVLYARLGRLWQDALANNDEAGVCYDRAISAGVSDGEVPEVMSRALAHYRRQGRPERALAVIERLLPATEDPRELASLWTERGSILASSGDEDQSVEAFDMALSYDPGNRGAVTGLSQILERRGDWEQLAQIFEARTEAGSPDERAEALRALARMSAVHLKDPARTERYLRQVVEIAPSKEDYAQLLALYGDDPARFEQRRDALAGVLGLGGPYMPRVIEFGKLLLATNQPSARRWAWCLLSPLMNSTLSDPQLKTTVLDLRKEFEKTDNTAALTAHLHEAVRPTPRYPALAAVLAELDDAVTLGRSTPEEAHASGTGKLDERTAVGKTFAGVAARLGLEGTLLTRAQELPEPFVILDGETRHVLVRAELLQLLSVAETSFLFSMMLEETRPGARVLASLPEAERPKLVPALFVAVGLAEPIAGTAALVERIRAGVLPEVRARWAAALGATFESLAGKPAALEAAGLTQWDEIVEGARRVGLAAAADLRFAARVITRLDETLPRMQTVGRIDDLDEFIAGAAPVRTLLGFAVTAAFGKALAGLGG